MKNTVLFLALLLVSGLSLAQTTPRVTKLGKNPVVFQGHEVTYVKAHKLYKTRVVAKLKNNTFEVADAYFKCSPSKCTLEKTVTRAFYSQCAPKQNSYACRGNLTAGRTYPEGSKSPESRVWPEEEETRQTETYWDGAEAERSGDWETDGVVLF